MSAPAPELSLLLASFHLPPSISLSLSLAASREQQPASAPKVSTELKLIFKIKLNNIINAVGNVQRKP